MSEVIIFGRSPFIHQVDVPRLLPHYTTIGINRFSQDFATDYCVAFDDPIEPCKAKHKLYPERFKTDFPSISPQGIIWYTPRIGRPDLLDSYMALEFSGFTVSVALNYALLMLNPSAIYLVGIDHNEQDAAFKHYDGVDGYGELTPDRHRDIKTYIAGKSGILPIYQTNPDAQGWNLPFKNLEELYV